jgi:hypothetical protein
MKLREQEDYQILAMVMARLDEYGEACLTQANAALKRLTDNNVLPDHLFLSEAVWHRRAYLAAHQSDQGYVLQAALWTLHGYGIVQWKAKEFWEYHQQFDLTPYAIPRFKPFKNCQATERSLLGQQAFDLFNRLSLRFESATEQ